MSAPHRLYRASAGTGKTYQLTGHFLGLLLAGTPPERILATTFTRKAAGEILDRVLGRLVAAAAGKEKLRSVTGEPADARTCLSLLAALTRRLDRFQVRTLDSFFVHLAGLFALDLDLPAEWRIADRPELEDARQEAIGRVLEEAEPAELVELLRALSRAASARSVTTAMLGAVDRGRNAFLESEAQAWRNLEAPPGLSPAELEDATAQLEAMELPRNANGEPNRSWKKARALALELVRNREWEAFLGHGLVKKVRDDEDEYYKKPIDSAARGIVATLLEEAAHHVLTGLVEENAANHAFLARFERAWHAVERERGILLFEDFPRALSPDVGGAADPIGERELDRWFRLDARIDHLLLDEFQDTAPVQWRNLAPLAEEILADGTGERSFFCVGDVKQSIYGWRQAEPRLFEALATMYADRVRIESLTESWRSSRVVLEAVNRLFAGIAENPVLAGHERGPLRRAAARWQERFDVHEAAKNLPGAAVLWQAPKPAEGESAADEVWRLAVRRVVELSDEAPAATIGVLVRTNAPIGRLIYLLRREGIRASGEGGNPLTDSDAVLAFLSLLHLADHPADSAAAFHVATSPFGPHLGLDAAQDDDARTACALDLSRSLRTRLVAEGYGAFASTLRRDIVAEAEEWGAWDRRRFDQLVDLAHAWDGRADLRPTAFATHVRAVGVEDPAAAGVRVMTVHKAKGLEFDAVILPELDKDLFRTHEALLTDRPSPFLGIETVSIARTKDIAKLHEPLWELRESALERRMEEALSVLYVAMTRAARRLEMIVAHGEREDDKAVSFAALLRAVFDDGTADGGELWRHEDSSARWAEPEKDAAEAERLPPLPPPPPLELAAPRGLRALPRRSPSADEGGAARLDELLRAGQSAALTRGLLVHRWLEELTWIEDFTDDDEALLALGARIEPDLDRRREELAELRAALTRPAVREALARPAGEGFEVLPEYPFSLVLSGEDGAETLWTGYIDRLVLQRRGAEVIAAEVLDYKSDIVDAADLDERVDFYRPQLEGYRRVVSAITGLAPDVIAARLLFLGPGEVVPV